MQFNNRLLKKKKPENKYPLYVILCILFGNSYVISNCTLGKYENLQNSKELSLKFPTSFASANQNKTKVNQNKLIKPSQIKGKLN